MNSVDTRPDDNGGMPDPALLTLRGVHKNFGGIAALNGVDLSVRSRQVVAVIGPNGSGKTTLFNVISGLTPADQGCVRFGAEGAELRGRPPWHIFRLGVSRTFQNIRLVPSMSVLDNIMNGLYLDARTSWTDAFLRRKELARRDARAREAAMEALSFAAPHLVGSADRPVGELSYADRRRTEIARAIARRPKLLLLDEPAAGMNPRETDKLAEDIARINQGGVAVALIEHKMGFIAQLASHIVVMSFGRCIAEGTYDDVRRNPNVIESYLGKRGGART